MNNKFSSSGRAPLDRYFSSSQKGRPIHSVTLGAYSYIMLSDVELGSMTPSNMLIGRYSSLAGYLKFVTGKNHIYKNSVTHYPFDADEVFEDFKSYGKPYFIEAIPRSRNSDNHFQIIIGNEVWIGESATIVGGARIGSGAIIGANSVVTGNIPPYAIAVGNPARVVKYRFDEETIKKLLAIKWWNWDIDKVCANVHKMYDVEKFLAEHYQPELSIIVEDSLGKEIEQFRAEGFQVYTFVADFHVDYPLWRRVISGFLKSKLTNAVLIFFLGENVTDKELDELEMEEMKNFPSTIEQLNNMPIIKHVPPIDGKIFSPYALRNSTHFITNREIVTLECLEYLHDTDVKIISAMDEGIFDGEPLVDWNKV